MAKHKGNSITELHVGALVERERRRQRVTYAVLARRLGRHASGIKRLMKASSAQTYLVWELSVALKHNFFQDLAHQLDAATEGQLETEHTELEALRLKYEKLQEEHAYLKKAVDLLNKQSD